LVDESLKSLQNVVFGYADTLEQALLYVVT
jgi:hypothetical protein